MKKKKILPSFLPDSLIPYFNWIWTFPALGFWIWEQFAHASRGIPLSWLVFAKGLILLLEAAILYGFSGFQEFYFLGMFPLSWLAASRFQWDLCFMNEYRFWAWLALFLGVEILILLLPDGKKLLWPLVPSWAALAWLFKFSFFLPLAFLTASAKRFQNASWVRWGGLASTLGLFLVFKGWNYFRLDWGDLYDLFVQFHFFAFFILGWLGLVAYDSQAKGTFRHILFPLFLLTAGFLFWGGNSLFSSIELETLQWVLVWMAGYGLEAFRKYMMDPSWHGRAVWFAVGVAFFGGVL